MTASKDSPLPFVRLSCARNRTATGRRTAIPARKAVHYFAFGRDRQAEKGSFGILMMRQGHEATSRSRSKSTCARPYISLLQTFQAIDMSFRRAI